MARPRPRKISDLKPTLTNLAQTSHFLVSFGNVSGGLSQYLTRRGVDKRFTTGELGLLCFSAQIPFANIATANINGGFTGVGEKFAHSRIFTPITLNFYVDKEYKVLKFLEHWMEYTAGGTHAPGGRTGVIKQNRSNYFVRMQYPEDYRMENTKIYKFERDYANNLEYTFFNLFPQNVTNIAVSYDQSKTLTASATFEYTRYVCGPISSISAYRNDGGFNNLTIDDLKEAAKHTYREQVKEDNITENYDMQYVISTDEIYPKVKKEGNGNKFLGIVNIGEAFGGGNQTSSDVRLKENIIKVGNSPSGINIYEWNYKSAPDTRYRGVMAHEILEKHPEAVALQPDGYMSVYYGKIDVKMEMVK